MLPAHRGAVGDSDAGFVPGERGKERGQRMAGAIVCRWKMFTSQNGLQIVCRCLGFMFVVKFGFFEFEEVQNDRFGC